MSEQLAAAIRRYTETQPGGNPYVTAVPGLTLLRANQARPPTHRIARPALCVVAQGAKWASFGDRQLEYRAGQALVVGVETPSAGRVTEASPGRPFLGLVLELDPSILRSVAEELDPLPRPSGGLGRSVFVTDFDAALADCVLRLVRLLETPRAIPTLHPIILREISYWLLTGPQGGAIARMALAGGPAERVLRALHHLRDRFAEPVRVEELAAIAQLSASAFHRQFKALTALTPLQYQKQIRLLEARRRLVLNAVNVETVAFQVGYESASQFSREYSRMFGVPPKRDAAQLRAIVQEDRALAAIA
jgi:AraC-like DNA-binding protein